jgi:hypothetical protein
MKSHPGTVLVFLSIGIILIAGCTTQTLPPATIPAITPSMTTALPISTIAPPLHTSPTTVDPQKSIITPGPLKTIKDSELWFTMQVPESWKVTTRQQSIPEGYEGLVYVTTLYDNPIPFNTYEFYIITYAITRDFDQAFRNSYRSTWTPVPIESTVIINGITFDRFESKIGDTVKVAYVVRKKSANERGFASVIEYAVNASSTYQQANLESFIATFQYKGAKEIKTVSGEETTK